MSSFAQYASSALQNDRAVVVAAVTQNGDALQFASDERRADPEIMRVEMGPTLYDSM
jgi:hypothetical protein